MNLKSALSFTAIVLGFFMALLDGTIVNIALPEMTRYFDGGVDRISWVVNAYNLAFAVFILSASRLADQFGRKKVFLLGTAVFGLASLLSGLAPNLEFLIGARFVQGLAGAIIVPVSIPLVTQAFPKEKHGLIIGLWGALSGLAAASGPALGGVITDKLNWEWIFYVNVPLAALSLVLTWIFIGESKDPTAGTALDWPGMLAISGAMFSMTYGLIRVSDEGWHSRSVLLLLLGAALLLAVFAVSQLRGKAPMLSMSLFRSGPFSASSLALLIVGAGLTNVAILTSFFLTRVMGVSELRAGLILSVMALGTIVTSALSSPVAVRWGSHLPATAGIALLMLMTWSLSGLGADASTGDVALRLFAAGLGIGMTMAPVMTSAVNHVPEAKIGMASGIVNMAKAIGSVLGVAIIVTMLQQNLTDRLSDVQAKNGKAAGTGMAAGAAKTATYDAYSDTFAAAAWLLLPGIPAALLCDRSPRRKQASATGRAAAEGSPPAE
ncbi:MFS transporter [Paenibacillus glufosinatiresistens]|uniref:MFS transporter n=1 Tax=Paenibacillus glufosinatiresistens TaxID=3070657 RepID=UPI00286E6CA3|nr:MFS transporter [Paenibacillus sp. YX.27]